MSILCDNCDNLATHLCGACLEAAYCSRQCQLEDRDFHVSEGECVHPTDMSHDEVIAHLGDHYDSCDAFLNMPEEAQKELIALRESVLIQGKGTNRSNAAHQRAKAKRRKAKNRRLKKKLRKQKKGKDKDKKGISGTAKGALAGGAGGFVVGGVPGAVVGGAGGAAAGRTLDKKK